MHTVKPDPAFANLSEEEISAALERYDSLCEAEEGDSWEEDDDAYEDAPIEDPVVRELSRLVGAYAERLDAACREHGQVPEDALLYRPQTPIERIAFRIFTEALHDSLQDADEE